ncbi:hypothetical protein AG1IA_09004 [Rhizoctonia solani AG-1 IA]|uniref:Uncharacterized protein n=1 Tax=Thanatephorus cucumeris (strain AG1-IA) TaxID=983506 RepID=L8WFL2_THACA|nr:hypothetical protein AG1IA_09004 [Rhizoctonia solani AG-1 IA]
MRFSSLIIWDLWCEVCVSLLSFFYIQFCLEYSSAYNYSVIIHSSNEINIQIM